MQRTAQYLRRYCRAGNSVLQPKGSILFHPAFISSPREQQIPRVPGPGSLYKEIAAKLSISFDTVQWHIRNIYDKLHVRSRSEAVAKSSAAIR